MTEKRFAFGKNWKSFLQSEDQKIIAEKAVSSLRSFIGAGALQGKTFLDVGCGSGIHSLAALEEGACCVTSIDIDIDSVECCQSLVKKTEEKNWHVHQGSMLDDTFMKDLGTHDMVYCWGVAHHTGDMYHALRNLAERVAPGGYLFVAIYNTVPGKLGSAMWLKIKWMYVSVPRPVQILMEWGYWILHVCKIAIRLKNPFRVMRAYKEKRGMSYRHDLIDWLGGYPYEHARAEELFHLYNGEYEMQLVNIKTTNYIGNNQLLFKKV